MIQIGNTLISEDLLDEDFVCNLSACKGVCCVEGEAGAPVTAAEAELLEREFDNIQEFLRPEGIAAIQQHGKYTTNPHNELETPLVEGKECAYVVFRNDGTAACGIEDAYHAGKTDFQKPISCHLYPVRLKEYPSFTAVNYHRWAICDVACKLGKELQVPVYKFLKIALIRRFGIAWYEQLERSGK
ncbi:MAG: DUF3109 family protein [Flavobacteriaceae bacterium]|nr:DUF3109 family protein [Flavobacteriaceae bacterium]